MTSAAINRLQIKDRLPLNVITAFTWISFKGYRITLEEECNLKSKAENRKFLFFWYYKFILEKHWNQGAREAVQSRNCAGECTQLGDNLIVCYIHVFKIHLVFLFLGILNSMNMNILMSTAQRFRSLGSLFEQARGRMEAENKQNKITQ